MLRQFFDDIVFDIVVFVLDIYTLSMVTSFANDWDYAPAGRLKYNHGVGAVCKFTLDIKDSPYTGMLKNGIQTGLIRISLQNNRNSNEYIPSAAIKFLRSGVSSANLFALPQTHILTNNLFDPVRYLMLSTINTTLTFDGNPQIIKKFIQGDDCYAMIGLSDTTR